MNRCRGRLSRIACVAALLYSVNLWAAESKPSEFEVKAAFLSNFARFVEWPEGTEQDTLRICIVGVDPFGNAFQTVLGRSPGSQPVHVDHLTVDNVLEGSCHILFVSSSETRKLGEILRRTRSAPMLTVSDVDGFAKAGGMVGFIIRKNKIRFQINPSAATQAGLRLSAKLLRLAEIVEDEGGR